VTPDINGNLTIIMKAATVYPLETGRGGLAFDVPITLAEICPSSTSISALTEKTDTCGEVIQFTATPPPLTVTAGMFSSSPTGYNSESPATSISLKGRDPVPRMLTIKFTAPVSPPGSGSPAKAAGIVIGYSINNDNEPVYCAAIVDLKNSLISIVQTVATETTTLAQRPVAVGVFGSATPTELRTQLTLRVLIHLPTANQIHNLPNDAKIPITAVLMGALNGTLRGEIPTTAGQYGILAIGTDITFISFTAEDDPRAT
jgi:hypothetical protein